MFFYFTAVVVLLVGVFSHFSPAHTESNALWITLFGIVILILAVRFELTEKIKNKEEIKGG